MKKVTRPHVRAHRPILIPSVLVTEGTEIRHGCQFLSSLLRALSNLSGGLGRFLPCNLGSHIICPGYGILAGISVLMVYLLDH